MEHYHLSKKNSPDDVDILAGMAEIYYERGDVEKAISLIDEAIEINPNVYSPYNIMGNILKDKREYDAAEVFYNIALRINPENPILYNNLGVLNVLKGAYVTAESYFNKAIFNWPQQRTIKKESWCIKSQTQ